MNPSPTKHSKQLWTASLPIHQKKKLKSGFLTAKLSTMLTSWSPNVSICSADESTKTIKSRGLQDQNNELKEAKTWSWV